MTYTSIALSLIGWLLLAIALAAPVGKLIANQDKPVGASRKAYPAPEQKLLRH